MRTAKSPRWKARSAPSSSPRSRACRAGASLIMVCMALLVWSGSNDAARSLDQLVMNGVAHQLGVVLEIQLLQDPRAVGADRVRAQKQLLGDLARGLAGGDQPHDLVLAIRE